MRLTEISNPTISQWETPFRGLEAALNIQNLALGLSIFFLARILGSLYFINSIEDDNIIKNSIKQVKINLIPFLIVFLGFLALLLTSGGFAVSPETKIVSMESFKYLNNLIQMPIVLVLMLVGIGGVLTGIFSTLYNKSREGIWFAGIGTILTVFSLFMLAGFNNTAYYPSTFDLQSSLTIENSSSSHYTLTAMSYVSLLIPFVFIYIWIAWKSINSKRIDAKEMETEEHKY